ncbi:P-loop containing nucleoside triphosphate hydrolase protein [Meira miltonrushii]|uniref:P-loop containing nucleoside triphosphate hydrolase protein n=1 Tax=Meira miltonrushii TaxID=1280837 RepID=A0A316VA75_9BASI|nr:P-loop containing nucleoside triphosphate hydrolase protein [Meira miltonrushii]PWN33351.1 P-loop containing nucleoside triphosphate hydrolase protein [Meira miltonrushii]
MSKITRKAYFVTLFERNDSNKPQFAIEHLKWLLQETVEKYDSGITDAARFVPIGIQVYLLPFSDEPQTIILSHGKRNLFITVLEDERETYLDEQESKSLPSWKVLCSLLSCTAGNASWSLQHLKIRLTSLSASEFTYLLASKFDTPVSMLDLDLIADMTIIKYKSYLYPFILGEELLGDQKMAKISSTSAAEVTIENVEVTETIVNYLGHLKLAIAAYEASRHVYLVYSNLSMEKAFLNTEIIQPRLLAYLAEFNSVEILLCLAKDTLEDVTLQLDATRAHSDDFRSDGVSYTLSNSGHTITVQNMRYRDQLMFSQRQSLQIKFTHRGKAYKCRAYVLYAKGKTTTIKLVGEDAHKFTLGQPPIITEVLCLGREDYSISEVQGIIWRRDLLNSVKAFSKLGDAILLNPLLFGDTLTVKESCPDESTVKVFEYMAMDDYNVIKDRQDEQSLNASQVKAAMAILSPLKKCTFTPGNIFESKTYEAGDRLVEIHGPPGTGKTSLISACCQQFIASLVGGFSLGKSNTIYAVCQSNVAVKNIALSLSKKNVKYKIIVCDRFQVWHQDLYKDISENLIISDRLGKNGSFANLFRDCNVILSTMAFLSSPRIAEINKIRPMSLLMVDEASQIHLRHYPHLLSYFGKTLGRVVFLGDDKQLAPFNAEEVAQAGTSVFELPHLREKALLLDTTYRLPVPQTEFISQMIYDGELKSGPENFDPKAGIVGCVSFIDVHSGKEKMRESKSKYNKSEVEVIVQLVQAYVRRGLKLSNLKILTPYDAQRMLLEKELMRKGLCANADMVFTVDSFQGHESEYIILSLVRDGHKTEEKMNNGGKKRFKRKNGREEDDKSNPLHRFHLGFLNNDRRTNVAITRNSRGLIVVSSKRFIEGKGSSTLIGKLDEYIKDSKEDGETAHWVDERDALTGKLPTHIFCKE